MNSKSLVRCGLLLVGIGLAGSAFAETGVFGSYIGINPDGAGNTWYGTQEWGVNNLTDFQGANLGTFDWLTDTLQISAFELDTFKSGGGDVTGVQLQYRVFKVGNTPGSFNLVAGGFLSNSAFNSAAGNTASGGGDQKWGVNPTATLGNLLGGISTSGTYNVEVFYRALTNEGNRDSNNGGANFTANFTAIPEPGSIVLMSIMGSAFAAVALLRRRKKV